MTLFSFKHSELENKRSYFRYLSILRDSLNNVLGPNLLRLITLIKTEGGNNKIAQANKFFMLSVTHPLLKKHSVLQTIFTEI